MKRILSTALCIALIAVLLPIRASAAPVASVSYDYNICVGGIYDAWANITQGADRATYQWQVDASMGDGSWYDLEDSAGTYGYKGTQTQHFQFVTQYRDNGNEIGSGWEDIPFRCKITLDGKNYYTDSFFMNIFDTSAFVSEIEALGTQFTSTTWGNVSLIKEENGIRFGHATAGSQLHFQIGCNQPQANSLLQRSDVKLIPEITVTENGKIKRAEGSMYYTPYMIDTGALVVEYKLRVMLGATDMGVYDSEKMIIQTSAPSTIAMGVAKQDMSLLKEMYTGSEKLVYIPKNTTVPIHENIGGTWYKISCGNFVGFVPVSALNVTENHLIDAVDVTIEEPAIGNAPQRFPPVHTEGCELFWSDPVNWWDKTTNEFMKPGEFFQEGHAYQLQIWVCAKDGYSFRVDAYDNIQTIGRINGKEVRVNKAYEQIPEQVIELVLDYGVLVEIHTCKLTLVKRVEPTCTQDGHEAYFHCDCGMNYADGKAQIPVDINTWGIIPATGHTPSQWRYHGDLHYRACTTCGEYLEDGPHVGGTASCVERAKCDVCGGYYGMLDPEHRWGPGWDYKSAAGHAWVCADCGTHSELFAHTAGPEATETTAQVCTDCGYILTPAKNHTHELTKIPGKEATCTEQGNIEYYICSGCSDRFADAEGKNKIPDAVDVTVAPLGHTPSDTWSWDSDFHWRTCETCNALLDETKMYHDMLSGRCLTCGMSSGEEPPQQETAEPTAPTEDTVPHKNSGGGDTGWITVVLIGLACFGVSITASVIVLKKKRK